MTAIDLLKQSHIFSGLNQEELTGLARLAVTKEFAASAAIFHDDDVPELFYIVVAGRVKVTRSSTLGKELIIAFFGPGEIFGEVAVFADKPYPGQWSSPGSSA